MVVQYDWLSACKLDRPRSSACGREICVFHQKSGCVYAAGRFAEEKVGEMLLPSLAHEDPPRAAGRSGISQQSVF